VSDTRRRGVDPARVAAFVEQSREAATQALREDDPDLTDDQILEILARAEPRVVAVRLRDRRQRGTGSLDVKKRAVAPTPKGLAGLSRFLPGGANQGGRNPGTNTVEDAGGDTTIRAIVADLRRNRRRIRLDSIAASSGAFTRDQLRYWMRANGKRLSDY